MCILSFIYCEFVVLSLSNSRIADFVDRIYPFDLEIKDTTYTDRSASYIDLHLEIASEGRLRTNVYDKGDDFNFSIVNFPFIYITKMYAVPAYRVDLTFQGILFLSGFP